MDSNYELIVCIVNDGFSLDVMENARNAGAKGGTIINGRGTAKIEALKKYDLISVTPEKEIVLILVTDDIKDNVLHTLYKNVGLSTPGGGIAFTLPVSDAIGLSEFKPKNKEN